jgi:excisionase family DNA binding protein
VTRRPNPSPDVRPIVRADVRTTHAPALIGTATPRTSARTNPQPSPTPPMEGAPLPTQNAAGPLLYTIPEAAALLRISRTKFYELLDAGEIESIHIGRSRKIPADALHGYLHRLRIPKQRKDEP